MENTNTFRIPAVNLPAFKGKLAKLRETAAKLKIGGDIGYTELLRQRVGRFDDDTQILKVSEYVLVAVHGDAPKFEGWSLRGRYDFTAVEGACLFLAVPGHNAPEGLHKVSSGRCDHCKANRARNDVFLLQHDAGHYAVVGRSCIKHYLGHVSPARLAAWAELIFDVRESLGGYESVSVGPTYHDLAELLVLAAHCVRRYGWKKSADDAPTKIDVGYLLSPPTPTGNYIRDDEARAEWKKARAAITDKDRTLGADTLAWLTDKLDPSNDYEHALKTLTEGNVGHRALGIAASATCAYCRAHGLTFNYPSDLCAPRGPSVHVGTLKERREFELVYRGSNGFEGTYGYTFFHKFTDATGNDFTWATGIELDLNPGDAVKLKATIKAHDDYKGRPQTKITRAKIIEETAA